MKFTPPIFSRIFKLFAATAAILAFASCSHTEEEGSVSLNIPRSVCEQIVARSPVSTSGSDEGATMKVFVTGDWQATKTVQITGGSGVTIGFDSIPSGSKVHVVCLIEGVLNENWGFVGSCQIGVSNELVISGKHENSVELSLGNLSFVFDDSSTYTLSLTQGFPGCTYRWEFADGVITTTSVEFGTYPYSGPDMGDPFMGTSYCTIYCDGTEITTLGGVQY
ncbi:MAG: hypothetical protein J6X11_00665 [Treponema sp.]|nr:hypothetical protein [Treponema sp.]MBP5748488.1 hypothetical protein [Treponema sp.]